MLIPELCSATFNKALMYARGLAIGAEARGKGVNIQLGPAVGPMGKSSF
jgi:beta-glucosidase